MKEKDGRDPLVSVIVPVYNAQKYLETCVGSILCQTYRNFELILIDDGSLDDSLAICRMLAESDERIRVYTQRNGGPGAARNHGLRMAQGEYVMFVDSDDYISGNCLENMYLAAQLGSYDIVQCKAQRTCCLLPGTPEVIFRESHVREVTKRQALNDRLYKVCVWGKLYTRHVLENLLFPEGMIYEDEAVYYRLVDRADRTAILEEVLYYYYQSADSVMRNAGRDRSTAFMEIYEDRIRYFQDREEEILLDGSYARFCLVLMLKISFGLVSGCNQRDIPWFLSVFRRYYPKVMASGYVSGKDKVMFTCFRMAPGIVGRIIGGVRRRAASHAAGNCMQ